MVETGTFLSKDPVEGEPKYLYVRGKPINLTDPSGMVPPTPQPLKEVEVIPPPAGYLEGFAASGTFGACVKATYGEEIVYDYNTGERAKFEYSSSPLLEPIINDPGISFSYADLSASVYAGYIWGFNRNYIEGQPANLVNEYSGDAVTLSPGVSIPPLPLGPLELITANFGANVFSSVKLFDVWGVSFYGGAGIGIGELPFSSLSLVRATYTPTSVKVRFPRYQSVNNMAIAIVTGLDAPEPLNRKDLAMSLFRRQAAQLALDYAPDDEWGEPKPKPVTPGLDENCWSSVWGMCVIEVIPSEPPPGPKEVCYGSVCSIVY